MEVGQICKKVAGRESGRYCIIYKLEGNFAEITGISKYKMCRRRRCNIKHLKPTRFKIKLNSEKQEEIEKKLLSSGLISKLGLLKDRDFEKKFLKQKKKALKEKKPKKKTKKEEKKETKK